MNNERTLRVGDELSAIANVEELVKDGRVPVKMQRAEVGELLSPEKTDIIFYNIPPTGFKLGKNGCTGNVDPVECSVEYFDGNGESLGFGKLVGVRVEEAAQLDKKIAEARKQFDY